ncbi:hypothetical protein [Bradyrhizobium sp. CCBAU 53415]|uniref:hypothetical protein n=1 Tax=Bradyrhizobium sp. CCBAU 53415 TaxID=1325119 RepID=UPI002306C4F2|nr:hypothetical protein [Bradyrhizobium sp. CCBAU 53415]MDA9465335.1 hypothetical protein [Bradyrhizobium sp. CCBAU 53415]
MTDAAHEHVTPAADALEIEAGAKRRLADEYDAAQERGEVQRRGGDETSKAEVPKVSDIGLTHKDIHEARLIRDAEREEPGIVKLRSQEELSKPTAAADVTAAAKEIELIAIRAGAELSAEHLHAIAVALRQLTLPAPRHAERDRLLIECRGRFYSRYSDHAAAQDLCASWRRYEATAWIRERAADACPQRHVGTEREFFWRMLRACPRSLSADRVRRIFGRLS